MTRPLARRWIVAALGLLLAACGLVGGAAPSVAPAATASIAPTAAPPLATMAATAAGGIVVPTSIAAARTGTAAHTATATRAGAAASATPGAAAIGCDNPTVTDLVARFLDAYNAGDQARLLAFFPAQAATRGLLVPGEASYFHWYWDVRKPSLRDEDGFEAYARDELPPYWAQRHAQHERLHLLRFQECGPYWDGNLAFVFELTRQADDLAPHRVLGKAEIDDAHGTIVLWSMGPREQPPATPTRP